MMADQEMRYESWIDDALRGVVRRAFLHAEANGLAGDHHFYVTFRTHADGIELPARLRALHPDQMTIVLQHQFWDLVVEDDAFSVTLKFRGRSERLHIPFAAVTAFADPAVNFGLQFKLLPVVGDGSEDGAEAESGPDAAEGDTATAVTSPAAIGVTAGDGDGDGAHGEAGNDTAGNDTGRTRRGDKGGKRAAADVIVLDSFRKT